MCPACIATVARHQELILQYAGFRAFDASARTVLEPEIAGMVRAQLKPRLIFGAASIC